MPENTEGAADQNAILGKNTRLVLEENASAIEGGNFNNVVLPQRKAAGLEPAIKKAKESAARLGIEPITTKI